MNKELKIYDNTDYIPKNVDRQYLNTDITTQMANTLLLQQLVIQTQQQNSIMLNMMHNNNNNNYALPYNKENNLLENIIKFLIIIIFLIWLFFGLSGKGWNPLISIPYFFKDVTQTYVLNKDIIKEKTDIKVCVGDYPCVTEKDNEKIIKEKL